MASTSKRPKGWDKIGPWTRMIRLGAGGFGTVYLGKRKSDEKLFAVKSAYFVPQGTSTDPLEAAEQKLCEQYSLSGIINEIRTLKKVKSPYIIRYLGCGTTQGPPEMGGRLLLDCYLEYLPRGNLADLLKGPLPETLIKAYTKDILRALLYLHFNKIVHGDIKCSNMLMGSKACKLADFGSAKDVRTSFFKKILFGTPGYKAPEVASAAEQTYASDIFSLGCTVLEMATFEEPEPIKWVERRKTYTTPKIPDYLSNKCKDFLSKCIAVNPGARWSASDLLKHPFITAISNPQWLPYDIPLDPKLESQILRGFHQEPIVPPNDDLDLNCLHIAPFSPIHVVPMKRRKISSGCQNVDESDVALPGPPPTLVFNHSASDEHSATVQPGNNHVISPSAYSPDFNRSLPGLNDQIPTPKKRRPRSGNLQAAQGLQAAIKKLSLAPQLVLEEMKIEKNSESVASTVSYNGFQVEFPAVAQLKGNDNDEDTSPLVVKICSEFEIPLPEDYQKWILDPDFDPDLEPRTSPEESYRKWILNPRTYIRCSIQ